MFRSAYKPLLVVMWLVLPMTALNYWRNWDQLPARVAVHFDANWQPNGYTSREGSAMLGLGIMAFLLVIFTLAAVIAHAYKSNTAWPILIVSYVVLGFCWYGNHSIIDFKLHAPAHSELVGPVSPSTSDSVTLLPPHS